jgi:hypothetical protein
MARPVRGDRDSVATETLTLRLTQANRAMLDALVTRSAAELEHTGVEMTATAYVRGLIRREYAQRFGVPTVAAVVVADEKKRPAPSTPPAERRAVPRTDDKKVRTMMDRVTAKGVSQKEIAALCGLSQSYLSKWRAGKHGLTEPKLEALSATLENLLQPSLPSVNSGR